MNGSVPLVVVMNVDYISDSINATHALLSWDAVDTSLHNIRGFFRGYQVPGTTASLVELFPLFKIIFRSAVLPTCTYAHLYLQ